MKNSSKTREYLKTYSLICIPLILGFLINTPIFGYYFPLLFSLLFLAFWFWVGTKFYQLNISKVYSLLIGNSINIISAILFIWSFFITSDENRNLLLAGFSQYYAGPTLAISARLYLLTNPEVLTNGYVTISYILMFLVFTAGFFYGAKR